VGPRAFRSRGEKPPLSDSINAAERLVEHAGSFAKTMLELLGEFYPFAGALEVDGRVTAVDVADGSEVSLDQNLIEQLRERVRSVGASGYCVGTFVAYQARVQIQERDIDSAAIVIEVDQTTDDPAVVFMLYRRTQRDIEYGEVLVQPGSGREHRAR
jgi:hypothetical protein